MLGLNTFCIKRSHSVLQTDTYRMKQNKNVLLESFEIAVL